MKLKEPPFWYVNFKKLGSVINAQEWPRLNRITKNLIKETSTAGVLTFRKSLDKIVSLTANAAAGANVNVQQIKLAYQEAQPFAEKEAKANTYQRIANEEALIDRLTLLSSNINKSVKIIWNYWRAQKAKDYIEWELLQKDINTTPLTAEGRLRLRARHTSIGKRIIPSFTKMAVQLWPLAALWVIKKVSTVVITKTVQNTMETRRTAKKLQAFQKKLHAGSSKLQPVSSLRKTVKEY